jgi:predicted transcriptional regulator
MPRSSNRLKEENFNFRVPADLKADFKAATEAEDRPAAQVIREFMRAYVDSRSKPEPGYDEWFRAEVQKTIEDDAGPFYTHEEVMREAFARLEARIKAAEGAD